MATVVFYEKPGCGNNTRQKTMLTAAGHEVNARNLLTEAWTAERLLKFFGNRPVAEWFNRAAPRVKSGEIVPEEFNADHALQLMLQDPLLIRRPLIESEGRKEAGFEQSVIHEWLGLTPSNVDMANADLESCPRSHQHTPCPAPKA
jgi:nitrogenase-associated protein